MPHFSRKVIPSDLKDLKAVLDSSELFPSIYLDEMIAEYFSNPESESLWFATEKGGKAISLGFCAPEKMTEGTFNLYALAVRKEWQGQGVGKAMMKYIENELVKLGHRLLIVETSADASMEATRQFYLSCGYSEEAHIRDFWKEGEGKVMFWKKLL